MVFFYDHIQATECYRDHLSRGNLLKKIVGFFMDANPGRLNGKRIHSFFNVESIETAK